MDDRALNPYAPSAVADTASPEETGAPWRVDLNELWVRDGAVFEGMDLGTGEIPPPDPVTRKVVLALVGNASWWVLASTAPAVFLGMTYLLKRPTMEWMWLAVMPGILPVLMIPSKKGRVTIFYKERRSRTWIRKGLLAIVFTLCAASALWFLVPLLTMAGKTLRFAPGFGMLAAAIPMLAVIGWLNKVPRPVRKEGKWMLLRGVAPAAMEHLRQVQGQSQGVAVSRQS